MRLVCRFIATVGNLWSVRILDVLRSGRASQQGRRDSNPQPPVLETGALPIELLPSGRRSGRSAHRIAVSRDDSTVGTPGSARPRRGPAQAAEVAVDVDDAGRSAPTRRDTPCRPSRAWPSPHSGSSHPPRSSHSTRSDATIHTGYTVKNPAPAPDHRHIQHRRRTHHAGHPTRPADTATPSPSRRTRTRPPRTDHPPSSSTEPRLQQPRRHQRRRTAPGREVAVDVDDDVGRATYAKTHTLPPHVDLRHHRIRDRLTRHEVHIRRVRTRRSTRIHGQEPSAPPDSPPSHSAPPPTHHAGTPPRPATCNTNSSTRTTRPTPCD